MNDDIKERAAGPVEVWLQKLRVSVACRIVRDDESDKEEPVESLSLRGAQREITGNLIAWGYAPAGRWETVAEGECVRKFRPGPDARLV
jgi:hypothetical protein